ncbi:MAG: hypothetical protein ACYTFG_21750, partial [Planctomycetota bacterium]
MMRRNRLLENYPSLAHIGLETEEQEGGARRDIYSVGQLRDAIDKIRDKRMEGDRLPRVKVEDVPIITLMAGYADGQTTTVEYFLESHYASDTGRLAYRMGNASTFLASKRQNVLSQTSDALKAKTLLERIEIEAVYSEMEKRAISLMRQYKMYYALFKRCRVIYSGARTASIVWDRS